LQPKLILIGQKILRRKPTSLLQGLCYLSTNVWNFGALLLDSLLSYIKSKIYLEASGGVGSNRFLSKIACELHKPQGITVINHLVLQNHYRLCIPSKYLAAKIAISDIPGLKGKTGIRLKQKYDATTMADLQHVTLETLVKEFGNEIGHKIFNLGRGHDNTPVINKQLKQTIKINKPAQCKSMVIYL